jgi:hypothetical protein
MAGFRPPLPANGVSSVFDADFVGMSVLPPERDPVLLIDADALAAGLVALQQFEPIAGRDHEIVQTTGCVNQFELAMHAAPELARNPASRAPAAFAKQIGRSLHDPGPVDDERNLALHHRRAGRFHNEEPLPIGRDVVRHARRVDEVGFEHDARRIRIPT